MGLHAPHLGLCMCCSLTLKTLLPSPCPAITSHLQDSVVSLLQEVPRDVLHSAYHMIIRAEEQSGSEELRLGNQSAWAPLLTLPLAIWVM